MFLILLVVRAHVPKMNLDELFEQKDEVAKAVLEELEKVNLCLCVGSREMKSHFLHLKFRTQPDP